MQTCWCVVVGSAFVPTLPAFMRSSASHPAGPHGQLVKKMVNRVPISVGGIGRGPKSEKGLVFVFVATFWRQSEYT